MKRRRSGPIDLAAVAEPPSRIQPDDLAARVIWLAVAVIGFGAAYLLAGGPTPW